MNWLSKFWYHLRYAWRLYSKLGWTWREAWEYPYDPEFGDGDPIDDADTEMSYMGEG